MIAFDQIAGLAEARGLTAVRGVEGSVRYHLNILRKEGSVEIQMESPGPRKPLDSGPGFSRNVECADPELVRSMARCFYGFGNWDAPYWFIGQEMGTGGYSLDARARAWASAGRGELCDCRHYHVDCLGDTRLHSVPTHIVPTWRPLIRILLRLIGRNTEASDVAEYQREKWGCSSGETALLDISGLPGKDLKEGKAAARGLFTRAEFAQILCDRTAHLNARLQFKNPKLLICYGASHKKFWQQLLEPFNFNLVLDTPQLVVLGAGPPTVVIWTKAPAAFGLTTQYWKGIEEDARKLLC